MSKGSERLKLKELERRNGSCEAKKKERGVGVRARACGRRKVGLELVKFGRHKKDA